MKSLLARFFDLAARRSSTAHDDTLRANQFNEPRRTFSPWLLLIR